MFSSQSSKAAGQCCTVFWDIRIHTPTLLSRKNAWMCKTHHGHVHAYLYDQHSEETKQIYMTQHFIIPHVLFHYQLNIHYKNLRYSLVIATKNCKMPELVVCGVNLKFDLLGRYFSHLNPVSFGSFHLHNISIQSTSIFFWLCPGQIHWVLCDLINSRLTRSTTLIWKK